MDMIHWMRRKTLFWYSANADIDAKRVEILGWQG